jgi:hypothetical protein
MSDPTTANDHQQNAPFRIANRGNNLAIPRIEQILVMQFWTIKKHSLLI